LDQGWRQAAEAGDGVIVDDHDAEGRVTEDDRPEREGDAGEVEGGAQRDAGDDAGERNRQHEEKRDRLAAEKARPRQRRRGERAEDQRDDSGECGDGERKAEGIEDVLAAPGDGKPFQRVAWRGKLVAAVLAREGIENDEGE